ncbi:hypothetical protein EEL49_07710 [Muribaculaceae bacterium Isolate-104 (HZI)]|nr:hypothetical protein EEL49_07710 [Muribaculaceae bacterium Isolate-104 (HZI)]
MKPRILQVTLTTTVTVILVLMIAGFLLTTRVLQKIIRLTLIRFNSFFCWELLHIFYSKTTRLTIQFH